MNLNTAVLICALILGVWAVGHFVFGAW